LETLPNAVKQTYIYPVHVPKLSSKVKRVLTNARTNCSITLEVICSIVISKILKETKQLAVLIHLKCVVPENTCGCGRKNTTSL